MNPPDNPSPVPHYYDAECDPPTHLHVLPAYTNAACKRLPASYLLHPPRHTARPTTQTTHTRRRTSKVPSKTYRANPSNHTTTRTLSSLLCRSSGRRHRTYAPPPNQHDRGTMPYYTPQHAPTTDPCPPPEHSYTPKRPAAAPPQRPPPERSEPCDDTTTTLPEVANTHRRIPAAAPPQSPPPERSEPYDDTTTTTTRYAERTTDDHRPAPNYVLEHAPRHRTTTVLTKQRHAGTGATTLDTP